MPTTYTTTRNGKPAGGLSIPQRQQQQQSTTVGSSIPVSSAENASRKKSLLPQPRTVTRAGLQKTQGQAQSFTGYTTQLPKSNQEQPKQTSTAPAEPPQSEPPRAEPENVKETPPSTNLPARPKPERVVTRSRSPVKPPQKDDSTPVPAAAVAAKKTSMPPPSRPARSASLRQPSAPKIVGSTDGKGHARHRSQVLSTPRTIGTAPVLSAPARQPEKSNVATKQPRPQFTTYQQHFSPKKKKETPRTLSTTERRTGKSAETDAAVAALQTELLQVCLLHSSSLQQDKEWKSAAQQQLREKYNFVAAKYKTLADEERYIQQQLNLKALYDWSVDSATLADNGGVEFQAQIQIFSQITQDVADMTADGSGRYTSVISVFQQWLNRVENIRESRLSTSSLISEEYIDTLGRAWREEVDDLTLKAELCLRELTTKITIFAINEDSNNSHSALVQIARRHRDVLTLMVDELKIMRAMELEMVNIEKDWLGRAADQVVTGRRNSSKNNNNNVSRRGIWRAA